VSAAAYADTPCLARRESLLVGPITGVIVAAAMGDETAEGVAVAISPDNSFKYLSYLVDYLGGN